METPEKYILIFILINNKISFVKSPWNFCGLFLLWLYQKKSLISDITVLPVYEVWSIKK